MRLALVGLPEVAETRYLPALVTLDDVELLAVVAGDPARTAWACSRYPIAHSYTSVAAMLEESHPDAAIVLEAPAHQADAAISLLRAAVPVLCDKPLGGSPASANAIAAAAAKAAMPLAVACPRRFTPIYEAAQRFFCSSSPVICNGTCYVNPADPKEPPPALSEMCNLLVWLCGEPSRVRVWRARTALGGVAHIHFSNGLLGTVAALPGARPQLSLELLSEGRSMRVEDSYWAWIRERECTQFLDHGLDFVLQPYTQQLQWFLASLRGDCGPGTSVADALYAWKLLAPVVGALLPPREDSA